MCTAMYTIDCFPYIKICHRLGEHAPYSDTPLGGSPWGQGAGEALQQLPGLGPGAREQEKMGTMQCSEQC